MTDPHRENSEPHATEGQEQQEYHHDPDTVHFRGRRVPKRVIFFGTVAVIAILVYCIANATTFASLFTRLGQVLAPVIIGGIIAYLCNPFLNFFEYFVFRKMGKGNLRRGISLLCTVLTVLAILAVAIALIVPELYESISQLVKNYHVYLNELLSFVQSVINTLPEDLAGWIDISDVEKLNLFLTDMFGSVEEAVTKLLSAVENFIVDSDIIENVWVFLSDLFTTFKNLFLGIFIAFYILSSKEKRIAQVKKFRAACFNDKQDGKIAEIATLVDKTFGGFIKGVLLDALAVGVVTFIMMSLFRVSEYNLLISAICAITNVIPVFGPFIGAIPSGLIVLITNPEKFVLFLVLVLVIQQIDGNILCPMIQGNNTGVSSLAVLVAITVMGGLFGIMGMVIGVPVFAVIIELVKRAIEERLVARERPTDTTAYYPSDAVGNAEEDVYYEHAHWKYKYDHSRLKPHVDKVLNAIGRIWKKKAETADASAADASAATGPAPDNEGMANGTEPTSTDTEGESGGNREGADE